MPLEKQEEFEQEAEEAKMSRDELVRYLKKNRELSVTHMTELLNRGVSLREVRDVLFEIGD